MMLLIDNYDSFTYNLYQFIGTFNNDIKVVRNDKITIEEIEDLNTESIVISPGPKSPKEAGICLETIRHFAGKKPMLGICLGHQCIGEAFGATVSYAKKICHGKQSLIEHDTDGIFEGINEPVKVARYHSLAVIEDTLPDCLQVTARTQDGEIMAMKHRKLHRNWEKLPGDWGLIVFLMFLLKIRKNGWLNIRRQSAKKK